MLGPEPVERVAASGNFTGTLANGTTWVADVPAHWNGTLLLYSHGYGLAGSSYDPNGSERALDTAVSDQFGTSMGGLVSALEAQAGAGPTEPARRRQPGRGRAGDPHRRRPGAPTL